MKAVKVKIDSEKALLSARRDDEMHIRLPAPLTEQLQAEYEAWLPTISWPATYTDFVVLRLGRYV